MERVMPVELHIGKSDGHNMKIFHQLLGKQVKTGNKICERKFWNLLRKSYNIQDNIHCAESENMMFSGSIYIPVTSTLVS